MRSRGFHSNTSFGVGVFAPRDIQLRAVDAGRCYDCEAGLLYAIRLVVSRIRRSGQGDCMASLRLFRSIVVVGVIGCSLPFVGRSPATGTPSLSAVTADTATDAPPVVQVREFPHSSAVSVVAWDADDATIGLRTSVNRTGTLVGGLRFGDHRLYMTPSYVRNMGGFKYATVTRGQLLLGTGWEGDPYSCFYGKECSPMVTVGVRLPDSLLRANRDSLVVTFYPTVQEPWTITLRRDLIAAYLNKVDSVVAELRKTATM
jgi:hypothetical protein